MSEWWTYSLSDFLMFSVRTYFRQFELLNRALWPLHLPALGMGVVLLACMLRPRPSSSKLGSQLASQLASQFAFLLLGAAWLWVAWAYHLQRYADIHTGAPWFAAAFAVQAVLLWMAARRMAAPGAGRLAPASVALALAVWPVLAPLNGRGWWQAEVVGMAPDPTVAATFGVLLFWRAPWFLWVIPLLWSASSGATLMALRAPQAWLLPALAAALVVARGLSGRQQVP